MSISSSASDRKRVAVTGVREGATSIAPITLSERSMTGIALIRMFVGYLWFQQLFWKMPPTFAGLYGYIVRESQSEKVNRSILAYSRRYQGRCSRSRFQKIR